jgi:hypothetical protein
LVQSEFQNIDSLHKEVVSHQLETLPQEVNENVSSHHSKARLSNVQPSKGSKVSQSMKGGSIKSGHPASEQYCQSVKSYVSANPAHSVHSQHSGVSRNFKITSQSKQTPLHK